MQESFAETFLKATKPVRYAAAAALSLLALFLLVLTIHQIGNLGRYTSYTNTITVEGTGTGTMVPNLATVSFTVFETAPTVAEAQAEATAKTDAALATMENLGIEEKDLKTTSYSISPEYATVPPCYGTYCPMSAPRITGYQVSQTVDVKVHDTTKAGDVLQALGSLGVQNVYGPNFTVDEDDAIKNVAREEAIENAKAKAEALADQLGVRLGKVVSFYENTGPYPMYGYDGKGGAGMMEVAQSAPSLPTGEQETTVSVSVTFEIH
ncbi:MAG TPA: SIMPL domain-containing protein [Candidatus Paceibacterota bacterium]|nr:SIMPL domain-containing protein [Candidatus Paceibacterota bacterium]